MKTSAGEAAMKYQIVTEDQTIEINATLNKWGEIRWHDTYTDLPHMMNVHDKGPSFLIRLFKVSKILGGSLKIVDLADGYKGNRKGH